MSGCSLAAHGLKRHGSGSRALVAKFALYSRSGARGSRVAFHHPSLRPLTRRPGCLALAIERKATVYTTDRVWKNLDLGIDIEVIR